MSVHLGRGGPLVSVVIPTFNRAHTLGRALSSVERQTYPNREVIVVDDGSTDETETVAGRFRGVKYVRQPENRGQAAARNAGISLARGEYIAFLDADDEWMPAKLEKQVERLEVAPADAGLITTAFALIDRAGRPSPPNPPQPIEGDLSSAILAHIEGRPEIVGVFSTLMFRKAIVDEVGLLDESLLCWEDADFYLRAAQRFKFQFVPESLAVKHECQDSVSFNWMRESTGIGTFWAKHRVQFGSRPLFRRYLARHLHGVAVQACLAGDIDHGRRLFIESLTLVPMQWHPVAHLAMSYTGARAYSGIWSARQRIRAWQ